MNWQWTIVMSLIVAILWRIALALDRLSKKD